MEDLKICQKPTKYGQVVFCEAVKVDMANSKDSSFNGTITSTLSLITVLFEILFEAINIHKDACGRKMDPKPSISLVNKTDTLNEYDFTINIFEDDQCTPKRIVDVVGGLLHLWLQGILQKIALYFDGSKQDHIWN